MISSPPRITDAAIQTTYVPADWRNAAHYVVRDGNGRQSTYRPLAEDFMLGLVDQHLQALRAHLGDRAEFADLYVPGYLSEVGIVRTLVWVRAR